MTHDLQHRLLAHLEQLAALGPVQEHPFQEGEDGGDEEQAIAALLHDAIDDAGVSAERFGERVARIVDDCTDANGPLASGEKTEPWLVRKRRHLEHLPHGELDSLLVSAADKAHNARDQMLDARRDAISCASTRPSSEGCLTARPAGRWCRREMTRRYGLRVTQSGRRPSPEC